MLWVEASKFKISTSSASWGYANESKNECNPTNEGQIKSFRVLITEWHEDQRVVYITHVTCFENVLRIRLLSQPKTFSADVKLKWLVFPVV